VKLKSLVPAVSLRSCAPFNAVAAALATDACAFVVDLVGVVVPEVGVLEVAASAFEIAVLVSLTAPLTAGFVPPMFNDIVTGAGASIGALSCLSFTDGAGRFDGGGVFWG
jgi:hypothetical protein